MNIQIHLTAESWKTFHLHGSDLFVKGSAYTESHDLQPVDFSQLKPKEIDFASWSNFLNSLNGFFALIFRSANFSIVAVDKIRSIPLFYSLTRDHCYVSDNVQWILSQIRDNKMSPEAMEEFQLTGYVTGRDTLFGSVKQLQAGEVLFIENSRSAVTLRPHRYYQFQYESGRLPKEEDLLQQLDQAACQSMQRLIHYAGGRQIVIPLSGGYDSRLIASLLKRLNYENVLTFTYGLPGNAESQRSKQVAESLEFKWKFVEYSHTLWRDVWKSDLRLNYQIWASQFVSLPHVQDWLAVKILKENKQILPNAVFAPGHTGDYISGGHIPSFVEEGKASDLEQLLRTIFCKHYRTIKSRTARKSYSRYRYRIKDVCGLTNIKRAEQLAEAFERWEWQERQAKFIVNSVRVYEFFDFDWWLPLWDSQFIRYWQAAPLKSRKESRLYKKYVDQVYKAQAASSMAPMIIGQTPKPKFHDLKKSIKSFLLRSPWLMERMFDLAEYLPNKVPATSPFALEGAFPKAKYEELAEKGYSYNAILGFCFLDEVMNDMRTGNLYNNPSTGSAKGHL